MAETRQLVKYTFVKVDPEALAWPEAERQAAAAEFGRLLEARAVEGTLLTYSTVGLRGDCDLLIWQAADSVDEIQRSESHWRSTQLGPSLRVAHSFLAMM
ncbi:MAG TPA: chlorite dismutase family protein, partial [Candidatus Dormibacteraeota bacterium]|nr:chlorite dismutase family protein [Candidatus Dormibacteraeota bacterium]